MDRREFDRIVRPWTHENTAMEEEDRHRPRRGVFSTSSGLVQLPRGSFIVENGRHIQAEAILYSRGGYCLGEQRPVVLRAVTHQLGRIDVGGRMPHQFQQSSAEFLRQKAMHFGGKGAARRSSRSLSAEISQSREFAVRCQPLTLCASPRVRPHPPGPGLIERSLVGRPVQQFKGRCYDANRERSRPVVRPQFPPPIVNLVENEETSNDESPCSRPSTAERVPSAPAEMRRQMRKAAVKGWNSALPTICFSSNGFMQMDMLPSGAEQLKKNVNEERPCDRSIGVVDLDSLSIAQGIGMNRMSFLSPRPRLQIVEPTVCNLLSDEEEIEDSEARAPTSSITPIAGGATSVVVRRNEERQSRALESLQPLLDAIEIESPLRGLDAGLSGVATSPINEKEMTPKKTHRSRAQTGGNLRSLNDMSQRLARKPATWPNGRNSRDVERSCERQCIKQDTTEREQNSETRPCKRKKWTSQDENAFNPYKRPYRQRSSRRSSPDVSDAPAAGSDPIWQFLNAGLWLGEHCDVYPEPHSHALDAGPAVAVLSLDDGSDAETWIGKRNLSELQLLVQSHSLCGLAKSLLNEPR